jgi:CheY-like chemotaxis protein
MDRKREPTTLQEEGRTSMEQSSAETKASVLIVDDNESMREALVLILAGRGHQCESAVNGLEAMAKIEQGNFDAVVTDVDMPEMDGIALTKELTRHHSHLPVMIITASLDDRCMELAFTNSAAREFLGKPFDISEFLTKFHKMLSFQRLTSELKA